MQKLSPARLRGGKGTCRQLNSVLQYTQAVTSLGSVAGAYRRVKRHAVRNLIQKKMESPLAIMKYREKPKWARVRYGEEAVYYKKWFYMKYCAEVVKHGLEHKLPLVDVHQKETSTGIISGVNYLSASVTNRLLEGSALLHPNSRQEVGQMSVPGQRFRAFAGQVPKELTIAAFLEQGCLPVAPDVEADRVYQLARGFENLPRHCRLCTFGANFRVRELRAYTRSGVFVKDLYGNVVTLRGLELGASGVLLPAGSVVLRTEALEDKSGGAVAGGGRGGGAVHKHVTFLLTEDYHLMLSPDIDSPNDEGYDVPFLASLPTDTGYSETRLAERWNAWHHNRKKDLASASAVKGAQSPDQAELESVVQALGATAADSGASESLEDTDADEQEQLREEELARRLQSGTGTGSGTRTDEGLSLPAQTRRAGTEKEDASVTIQKVLESRSQDDANASLQARRIRVAAVLQEKQRRYAELLAKQKQRDAANAGEKENEASEQADSERRPESEAPNKQGVANRAEAAVDVESDAAPGTRQGAVGDGRMG
eukprot:g2472.t1